MAAFIQKLFKSRKVKTPSLPRTATTSESDQPEKPEDHRLLLRQQQAQELSASPDQQTLARLAIEGTTAAIRQQAAGLLQDEQQLQQVQKQAKGKDKNVYQTVKYTLKQLKEAQAAESATREKVNQLVRQAQDQANSEDTKLYQARLEALQAQWQKVENAASAEQAGQFLEACHHCRERLTQMEQARQEAERHQEQARQRQETLLLLQQTLNSLKTEEPREPPSVSSLDALQKTQENRWLEATRDTDVSRAEQKAYEQAMLTLRNFLGAVRRYDHVKETANALVEPTAADEPTGNPRDQASALLNELEWPKDFPKPPTIARLHELSRPPEPAVPADTHREDQRALADTLKDIFRQLEPALEARQFRESKQLLKNAQNQFQQLDARQRKGFQARMQLLTGQFKELSDWQGFATKPKQIALCEQMEYLAEQPMEPEAKAGRIHELQNEWRELGGSSDRTLWNRFKAASDQAYEPCKAYFEAKSDLKQTNLRKREAICAELSTFLTSVDWANIDWKAAERIHQAARQEWKAAWPVDFRDNRQIQKKFDELLKKLEQPLDKERQKNESLKQEIVEKAQALVSHTPLQDAMEQAKGLQNDWKAIGITRRREDRKLWQAFRTACDQIFARREAQRHARQQANEQADQAAQLLFEKYAQLTKHSEQQAIQTASEELRQLDTAGLSGPTKEQIQKLRQQLAELMQLQKTHQQIGLWQSLVSDRAQSKLNESSVPENWKKLIKDSQPVSGRDLAIRAEILVSASSPEEDQNRRMEIQVQRLSDGLGSTETQSPIKEMETLIALWCLHPLAREITLVNAERLNRALKIMMTSN